MTLSHLKCILNITYVFTWLDTPHTSEHNWFIYSAVVHKPLYMSSLYHNAMDYKVHVISSDIIVEYQYILLCVSCDNYTVVRDGFLHFICYFVFIQVYCYWKESLVQAFFVSNYINFSTDGHPSVYALWSMGQLQAYASQGSRAGR